jgi:hypothetical protein
MLGEPSSRVDPWDDGTDGALEADEVANGVVAVPAFAMGGRVERTGIALVHQGEWIVPAEGSEAIVSSSPGGSPAAGPAVDFTFRVAVEVVGELDENHLQQIAAYLYEDLDSALRSTT